eukprot:Sspe_Gene.25573::Locus_10313_Transcript_1_1_Confidence_1.000_Length_2614::g.25573::m.25573/K20606/ANP1; mitogen-activated protein kinase kinase kinase ANP1
MGNGVKKQKDTWVCDNCKTKNEGKQCRECRQDRGVMGPKRMPNLYASTTITPTRPGTDEKADHVEPPLKLCCPPSLDLPVVHPAKQRSTPTTPTSMGRSRSTRDTMAESSFTDQSEIQPLPAPPVPLAGMVSYALISGAKEGVGSQPKAEEKKEEEEEKVEEKDTDRADEPSAEEPRTQPAPFYTNKSSFGQTRNDNVSTTDASSANGITVKNIQIERCSLSSQGSAKRRDPSFPRQRTGSTSSNVSAPEVYNSIRRPSEFKAVLNSINSSSSSATQDTRAGSEAEETAHCLRPTPSPRTPSERHPASSPCKPPKINWKKGDKIGSGSFGTVYKGLDMDNGCQIAIKEMDFPHDLNTNEQAKSQLKCLTQEIRLLSTLTHPNIVKYLGMERRDLTICIFTEYVSGGSILALLHKYGRLGEAISLKYTRQILSGLEFLHNKDVVHRDIKCANVLVDSGGSIKLADFGNARQLTNLDDGPGTIPRTLSGSPYWMAPEVIRQTGHGKPADVWSVGATVVEMVTGKPPCSRLDPFQAMYYVGQTDDLQEILPGTEDGVTEMLRAFLERCFVRKMEDRATVPELQSDPWLRRAVLASSTDDARTASYPAPPTTQPRSPRSRRSSSVDEGSPGAPPRSGSYLKESQLPRVDGDVKRSVDSGRETDAVTSIRMPTLPANMIKVNPGALRVSGNKGEEEPTSIICLADLAKSRTVVNSRYDKTVSDEEE